ncbi:MAG: hypothetical protein LUC91_01565 [Prevotella sp.]|nr:hypothetical protein [Prevotella sp.]
MACNLSKKREKYYLFIRLAIRRYKHNLKRKRKKKKIMGHYRNLSSLTSKGLLFPYFTESTRYIFWGNANSHLSYAKIKRIKDNYNSIITIPRSFSIIDNPEDTYNAIMKIIASCLHHKSGEVVIDYTGCESFTLEAQILLDIILKDILRYYSISGRREKRISKKITDKSIRGGNIRKMLFSVGSQAVHTNKQQDYPDVIPYNLCIHRKTNNDNEQAKQKELDTTSLSEYVRECLQRMGRKLPADKIHNLYTIIGEILINAEEHSSTHYRYSIGYFEEQNISNQHIGTFQLVIMNMGRTIYEKFHDEDCPNKMIVPKMKDLSDKYTKRHLWRNTFDEETLWTLYALQEGVTSVYHTNGDGRGNGSIQFIDSFFKLRNNSPFGNNSIMVLQSGHACIVFDGTYGIKDKEVNGRIYKIMTFNDTDKIEDAPDNKYVKRTNFFFPGTFIYAKIIF